MAGIELRSFGHHQGPFYTIPTFDDKIYLVCSHDSLWANLIISILILRDIRFHINNYEDFENNSAVLDANKIFCDKLQ